MDVQKIGSFLGKLRKEKGWAQEQAGQYPGVTNKTISRWETGSYMPPVEMLPEHSKLYQVSINELLSGQRLTAEAYYEKAEENIQAALESSFSLQEKIDYFKKKWQKDHRSMDVLAIVAILGIYLLGLYLGSCLQFAALLLSALYCGLRNNAMMTYVEAHAFDGSGKQ